MNGGVEIRAMQDADAPEVHAIHTDCLRRTLRNHYEEHQIVAWMTGRAPEGYLRARDGGENFLVAVASDHVVGFTSWAGGELLSLFVHPDAQRFGLGTRLVEAAMAQAGAVGSPIVAIKAALGATRFYEKFGFLDTGPGSTMKRGVEIPDRRMRR